MGSRDVYFQKLRGLAIFAVVLVHIVVGSPNFMLVFRQFINFPVAIFYFLSGYFIRKSMFKENGSDKRFIIKRLKRILIPYFFWSLLSLVLIQKFYHFNLKLIMINLLTGQVVSIYYFIIVMVQLIIITPILIKHLNNKIFRNFALSLTPISLLVLYIARLVFGRSISFPYYTLPFTVCIAFYYYGIIIGNNTSIEEKIVKKLNVNLLLYVICIIFSIIEGFVIFNKFGLVDFAESLIKISSYLTAICLINVLLGIKKFQKPHRFKILATLGDYSFGIYLIHIFVFEVVKKFLILLKLPYLNSYSVIIALIVILGSYVIIKMTIKVIGPEKSKNILGF